MNNFAQHIPEELRQELLRSYYDGELSAGQILKLLRKEVAEMNQTDFAALIGISRRTLSDLEQDLGSPTLTVFNAAFKPFGLTAGLIEMVPSAKAKA